MENHRFLFEIGYTGFNVWAIHPQQKLGECQLCTVSPHLGGRLAWWEETGGNRARGEGELGGDIITGLTRQPPCMPGGRGVVLSEKFDGGVRPTSQNPYPIYDQNLRFLLP